MSIVLTSLNDALRRALSVDEHIILIGEDILDPYGGAFKVTRGLSSDFPGQVIAAPISEAALVGAAAGMALRGLRPVVEIMFGDFLMLAADALVNTVGKFIWMYNDQVKLPLVVRTPMGGRRGYGPTHSQTLEKHFMGAPGLNVVAPCNFTGGAGELLYELTVRRETPTLFIENKLQYLLPLLDPLTLTDFDVQSICANPDDLPCYRLTIRGGLAPVVTIAAYGYMAELTRQAQLRLAYEDEIFCELLVFTHLTPFELTPLVESVSRTGRLLAVEEGTLSLGWGAELLAQSVERLGGRLRAACRVAGLDLPVPAALSLERQVLPGVDQIIQSVKRMM